MLNEHYFFFTTRKQPIPGKQFRSLTPDIFVIIKIFNEMQCMKVIIIKRKIEISLRIFCAI